MAQSDIMRLLSQRRVEGDGWTTVKELEDELSGRLHPRPVRKQVNRLVAYNMVETRAVSARLREFRIKEAYVVQTSGSPISPETAKTNNTPSSAEVSPQTGKKPLKPSVVGDKRGSGTW